MAVTEQSQGNVEHAIALYRRLLKGSPEHAGGSYNLALLLSQQGQHQEALTHHDAAVRQIPEEPWVWVNRGNSKAALRAFESAIADYDQALKLSPHHPDALINKGNALQELSLWSQALQCHEDALALRPEHDQGWLGKARSLVAMRHFEAGLTATDKLIELTPLQVKAWCLRGLCLNGLSQYKAALEAFDHALRLDDQHAQSWCGRGQALEAMDRPAEAEQAYRTAISLDKDYADAWINLGVCLQNVARYEEAAATLTHALELTPLDLWARWNLGLVLMQLGRMREAWPWFESRWEVPDLQLRRIQTAKRMWGGDASERPVLLWGEQGIGDQILYASILAEVARLPQKKYIALDKRLIPLFARSMPGLEFVDLATVSDALDFAEQLPLGSLPGLFRPDLASFNRAQHPYLQADTKRSAALRHKITREGKLVCGVSWSSSRKSIGRQKSLALEQMLLPLALPHLHFVDLQYGDTAAERLALKQAHGIEVQHLDELDNFHDLDGLAALIQAVDIVITISNSTAHLAGALGKPTLLLLPSGKGQLWYWTEVDSRIPWYPSIEVFRQDKVGDWEFALQSLQRRLTSFPH